MYLFLMSVAMTCLLAAGTIALYPAVLWVVAPRPRRVVVYMTTGLFAHLSYIGFFYLILGLSAAVTCIAGVYPARPQEQR